MNKNPLFLSVFVLSILLVAGSFTGLWQNDSDKKLIVINAGHGGQDTGATEKGVQEKDLLLEIVNELKKAPISEEYQLVFLRDTDTFFKLEHRLNRINTLNADLVLDLHINSAPKSSKKGAEAYVKREAPKTLKTLAKNLLQNLPKPIKAKQVQEAGFYLLKNGKNPTITLELGFITNKKDRAYLSSEKGQKEIAQGIITFIETL